MGFPCLHRMSEVLSSFSRYPYAGVKRMCCEGNGNVAPVWRLAELQSCAFHTLPSFFLDKRFYR